MSLISMAVYDTVENGRTLYTEQTLRSLLRTVDWDKHRLIISDNGSCEATHLLYEQFFQEFPYGSMTLINNGKNLGTAEAINQAWQYRKSGEHCIKIDNDVVINYFGWADELERVVTIDPTIGQVGLKRKDLWEHPEHHDGNYKSTLKFLQHKAGEPWITVEKVKHVMGTCVLHSSALLDAIGYLVQPHIYGFDDSLMSFRANIAGFQCVFLPHINIDHIDTGASAYQGEKEKLAGQSMSAYNQMLDGYRNGMLSIYYNPYKII